MGNTFQYQESLEDTALSEMFANIYRHRVPGLFEISHDGKVKRIFIHDGSVIHASSTDRADRLGAHLYRTGKLTREQLAETIRLLETTGKRHGQILIEEGMLSPGELYQAIRSQVESIVWSVFAWQTGKVSFKIGEYHKPLMIRIHLPMRQVIVRGVKQVPDAKALVSRLGKKSTVFRPTYSTEDLIEIALDGDEYGLLRLVDGERPLYELCAKGPFGVPENARLLYAFHILHLIERGPEEAKTGGVKIRYPADPPS
jgi:hypothetical protein